MVDVVQHIRKHVSCIDLAKGYGNIPHNKVLYLSKIHSNSWVLYDLGYSFMRFTQAPTRLEAGRKFEAKYGQLNFKRKLK